MLYPPLSVDAFHHVLRIGLGRAILYLKQHDDLSYRSVIEACCLGYTAYDRDFEGHRADYLFDVLQATGDPQYYRDVLLRELDTAASRDDAEQRWWLATHFAAAGDDLARQQLQAVFQRHVTAYASYLVPEDQPDPTFALRVLACCLIALDGAVALVDVAAQLSALPAAQRDGADHLELLHYARAVDVSTDAMLAAAADTSLAIATFLAEATDDERQPVARRRPPAELAQLSYAALRQRFTAWERVPLPWLRAWGRAATQAEVQAAADDMQREGEPGRLRSSLRIFFDRAFPRDHTVLMTLLEHPDADVAWAATLALAQVPHAEVHALALGLLGTPDRQREGITLLVPQFVADDMNAIHAAIARTDDDDALHVLGWGVRELLAEHASAVDSATLLLLYEKGPCASCRNAFVDQLLSMGALPANLAAECAWDSYLDTRALVTHDAEDNADRT